ncbi:MAG: 2-oxoglutarate dehydrogenase, E2 component, dihydrolipoamide succinyltransferase, partial [Streptomycetaceae bacterium]|nr:2-oxoglutarate dehydrogenase, E2 component, dihydrolipoamide succinyltransferase [Streptomycetaceae bacterium]
MAVSVTLPALGESVSEGTITRWLKAEGEHVEADEPLLEVSTDKVDTEIPAPASGVLASIKVAEDETVEVGSELAIIDDGTGAPSGASISSAGAAASPVPASAPAPAAAAPAPQAKAPAPASAPAAGAEGTAVLLPALGESVSEGTVTRWLKQVGEEVAADEPLLEVSTDKVDTEIPAPASGTLLEILIGEDETAEVGAKLAVIGAPGATPVTIPAPAAPAPAPQAPAPALQAQAPAPAPVPAPTTPVQKAPSPAPAPASAAPAPAPAPSAPAPVLPAPVPAAPAAPAVVDEAAGAYVTPLVRKLAAESGVALAAVKGTGVGGRIRKQDVIAAAEAAKAAAAATAPAAARPAAVTPSPLRGQTVPMTRVRKAIAKHMVDSLRVSAQLTTVVEVDVTKIMKLREKAKSSFQQREGVKLSPMPFFVKAAAEALKLHPVVNARVND